MSGGTLSPEQIAALVAAAGDGQLDAAPAPAPMPRRRRVRKIDFTRPSKFTTEQQRRLERAHVNFCRSISTRLSAEMRAPISVELIDTAQLTWANALDEIPKRSVSGIVDVQPIDAGRVLLTAELSLLLGMIERLLGGQAPEKPVERTLTDVDRALTARLFQTLLYELSISFNDLAELQFVLVDVETERAPAQLAPLSEPTLAMTLEVKFGRQSATMVLLIPHRSIEPVLRAPPAADVQAAAADAAAAVSDAMSDVIVELRAEVGSVDMALEHVLALQPGDVLRLDGNAEEGAVTLFADAVALQRAKLGRNGRMRAVGVLGPVGEELN